MIIAFHNFWPPFHVLGDEAERGHTTVVRHAMTSLQEHILGEQSRRRNEPLAIKNDASSQCAKCHF